MEKQQQALEESYDQQKLSLLKKEVALPKSELFELVNDDDKLTQKLKYFNREGYKCIERDEFYEAIVFLNEAQITLEYAANCGKTIERSLIITTLHNEACIYQRMWQLQKSGDYLQAIIYNISSFLEGEEFQLCEEVLDDKSNQSQKLATILHNKLKLINYYLQFCAVSSQLKRHENSLNAASRSLDILKQICEELHEYETFIGMKYHTQLEKNILLQLRNIKDFKEEQACNIDQNVDRFLSKAKKSISMFQKKIQFNCKLLDSQQKEQLRLFSIGNVMQVYPQVVPDNLDRKWIKQELNPLNKIYKALFISIAHFTMATELRLIVSSRYGAQNPSKKTTAQFKSSQLHHLIAIITVALYVPYETLYFEHILGSFKNHYQIDLTQITESTLSQELSNTLRDDQIHLQISSLYRKKKSSLKLTENHLHSVSPTVHDQLKRSKPKNKTSQENHSIKQKFKVIADSQRQRKQTSKNKQGKSVNKKSKSKRKGQSRTKQGLQSPISQKKSHAQLQSAKPTVPTSRSKSRNKKKSAFKVNQISSQKKIANAIRSEHEYGFKGTNSGGGVLLRTNKAQTKKSLRSSEKKSQLKKSQLQKHSGNEVRFIRQGRSPNNIPKSAK